MDEKVTYTDCELRYIDPGYDLAGAGESCASGASIFPLPPPFFEGDGKSLHICVPGGR